MSETEPAASPPDSDPAAGPIAVSDGVSMLAPELPATDAAGIEADTAPSPLGRMSRGFQTTRGIRRHLRAVRVVLNVLLLLALLYTITLTKALLIPLVLAAFIGLALNPIVAFGTRIRLPRWLTASVLMIGLIVGIGSGVGLLAQPAIGWFQGEIGRAHV